MEEIPHDLYAEKYKLEKQTLEVTLVKTQNKVSNLGKCIDMGLEYGV